MTDGRSNRRSKVVQFIDALSKDRAINFARVIKTAQLLDMDGFKDIKWESPLWTVTGGRLIQLSGKNSDNATLNFSYSPSLGGAHLSGEWADIAKALFSLRFHRKNQACPNQRNFITAVSYIAHAAISLNLSLERLTPEALDLACSIISKDYSDGVAYNMHKSVAEFAGHCDANFLCRIPFKYKYSKMNRPDNTDGVGIIRVDSKEALLTTGDKLIDPSVFRVLGGLFQCVPKDHKYRFYILFLTLIACTGRRFSEITLLPIQTVNSDADGKHYIEYFPRKQSQGEYLTPRRKLYLLSSVASIVSDAVDELCILCHSARDTAAEMFRVKGADVRFLSCFDDDARFYKKDIEVMGLPKSILDANGWIVKNGFSSIDLSGKSISGKPTGKISYYTNKDGIRYYCNKNYKNSYTSILRIDQFGTEYYLNDLLLVRYVGSSSGAYSISLASQCTHCMVSTFIRYLPDLANQYSPSVVADLDFTSHQFRHTLNTLLDEGGLTDLLQTEWFGRSNPRDTKAYQHTSREKRALMLREDIKSGRAGGGIVELIMSKPVSVQDAILDLRVRASHDVGTGTCIHDFSQIPCDRHLQCTADCSEYVWLKNDRERVDEIKRQFAMNSASRETAIKVSKSNKPKISSDWVMHYDIKIATLSKQLNENGIYDFDWREFLKGIEDA